MQRFRSSAGLVCAALVVVAASVVTAETPPAGLGLGLLAGAQPGSGDRPIADLSGELGTVVDPGGRPVKWSEWLVANGPVVLVAWASWAPRSAVALEEYQDIAEVAAKRGMRTVLLAVQEPLEDSVRAVGDRRVTWFHDRHGGLLKRFRITRVPSAAVVAADGTVLARFEATAAAGEGWEVQ